MENQPEFLSAMCERFLAMWAGLPAIMAYVIDNGEIHAGPKLIFTRAGEQKLIYY